MGIFATTKMNRKRLIDSLRGRLIVSCQAECGSPFNKPVFISAFARAAEAGEAAAVRIRDFENVSMVRSSVRIPIIGLTKSNYPDGTVLITPSLDDALILQDKGADIIAVDGTRRPRHLFTSGPEMIIRLKQEGIRIVLADVDSVEDAINAEKAGADMVATTLSGYTPETRNRRAKPDFDLVKALYVRCSIPVLAEGHIWMPEEARQALECGAWSVVIGSAITRPVEIVKRFTDAMSEAQISPEEGK
jgi:N-acylglucosamine-6-phosphate 2-epimerase